MYALLIGKSVKDVTLLLLTDIIILSVSILNVAHSTYFLDVGTFQTYHKCLVPKAKTRIQTTSIYNQCYLKYLTIF